MSETLSSGPNSTASTKSTAPAQTLTYALVGNPNCGKTTLFNALTGLKQKIGNYPGVTVERKIGECMSQHGQKIRIIDLPGSYSLNARSPDEVILRDVLLGRQSGTPKPDRVICVIDASNLERNLYLATQIIELGLPTILVLNMMDMAQGQGLRVSSEKLQQTFGIPVIPMQANIQKGSLDLKIAMSRSDLPNSHFDPPLPEDLKKGLLDCKTTLMDVGIVVDRTTLLEPLYLVSGDPSTLSTLSVAHRTEIQNCRKGMDTQFPGWEDQLVTARYERIQDVCDECVHKPEVELENLTDKLDGIFLHHIWGWTVLIGIMACLFFLIFKIAEGPMGWIETGFESLALWVQLLMSEGDLRDLITDGVIAGVGGVVIFLPQILILFFFIGLMEDTGYMARVAFIMDRMMNRVGLNGKSFLPLLSSYACAVPGVMATRTIESFKDRLITILVLPFASCSARLPVYLLMIATMVPSETVPTLTKVLLMLTMYFLGTGGAFFFAWLFHHKLLHGESSPMIMELPTYKMPSMKSIALQMIERTRIFLKRAGTIILGISILLWFAATYPKSNADTPSEQLANSFAGQIGHMIEPVIKPLGYDWKIGIGLVASFAAREVFVSTMSIIYSVEEGEEMEPLRDSLRSEVRPDGSPMYTPLLCLSIMVFYVFAMQCMSTLAVVKRETNSWKWPLFQFTFMTLTAYFGALLVYQVGNLLGFT